MDSYYQKEELKSTPSLKHGIHADQERRYRKEGANFIRELGTNLNLGHNTIATAIVYYHRFYMVNSFKENPRFITACSCLFLAGKAEETPKRSGNLMRAARALFPSDETFFDRMGDDPIAELVKFEGVLMLSVDFEFNVEHPYQYLIEYGKCLIGSKTRIQQIIQMAWNCLNDSYRTTICLEWEPEVIAIGLLHLCARLSKFDVVDWKGRQPEHRNWWDLFVEDLADDVLEDISSQIMDSYRRRKVSRTITDSLPSSSTESHSDSSSPENPTSTGADCKLDLSKEREAYVQEAIPMDLCGSSPDDIFS